MNDNGGGSDCRERGEEVLKNSMAWVRHHDRYTESCFADSMQAAGERRLILLQG